VAWEIIEFGARLFANVAGVDALLVQYGLEDTMLDLLFDALGAVVVAVVGTDGLEGTVEELRATFERRSGES